MISERLVFKPSPRRSHLERLTRRWLNELRGAYRQHGFVLIKRVIDLYLCVMLAPFLLILMAVIALAIRLDSPGPALFVQERVGRGGRRFRIYKFRTLQHGYSDAEHRALMRAYIRGELPSARGNGNGNGNGKGSAQTIHKPFTKAEMTRVGRILRKTSLDELPQIFNVLRGEMSLVGPRPHVPWEVSAYNGWHTERCEVLPGITGLAQVRGRSGLHFDEMARYDIEYIRRQSLKLDLKIMWWTIASIVSGDGAG